jgi:hypothetical protein
MQDICAGAPTRFIVVGFFTPNYLGLASKFSDNLRQFDIPHHLYAIDALEWYSAILMKPTVIERARVDYPNCSIINMDVDCIVKENIEAGLTIEADVGLVFSGIRAKYPRLYTATRVSVWNPTPGAAKLLARWKELCGIGEFRNDEVLLMQAVGSVDGVSMVRIPKIYQGCEVDAAPQGAAIVHESAYREAKKKDLRKRMLRAFRDIVSKTLFGVSADDLKHGKRIR